MEDTMIATHLENLDRRLTKVEQILPTLATKDDILTLATKEELAAAIAPLATKEELATAIAPLATREELDEKLAAQSAELRRHMTVLNEAVRSDIQLLAEHAASERPKPRKG